MRRLLVAAALGTMAGCGATVTTETEQGASAQCTEGPPSTLAAATVDVESTLVSVSGTVTGNVAEVVLESERTRARHRAFVNEDGSFSMRVPPGTYTTWVSEFGAPLRGDRVTVAADAGELVLEPCAQLDCMLPVEPSFPYDPNGPPGASVTGQFSASGAGAQGYLGHVEFLAADPSKQAGYGGTGVDGNLMFEFDSVPPGTYHVVYESRLGTNSDEPALQQKEIDFPFGRWIDDRVLDVQPPAVEWQGTIPTAPVHIEVRINGEPMPDNGRSDANRGFLVLTAPRGGIIDRLPLGSKGAAAYDLQVIPGEYMIGLLTYEPVGHGVLSPLEQDVLPTGAVLLGPLTVTSDSDLTQERTFDVGVTKVRLPPSALSELDPSAYMIGQDDSFTWIDVENQALSPSLAYVGCHALVSGPEDYPSFSGAAGVINDPLGEVCVPCGSP